ncbi:ABC transporter permease [Roseospira visakhapatnamensis]|uniref:Transport permease protein n=1 Tax=Roseospira visakhapatnamensis TaxID=390880 RepID=A0A7W6WAK3_9PROT|nr:ABC transporter permease [Roseospira visakhapatnamensis]MBB4267064.1 lipopolysaccharide transport system permease protein [Roseospira visakhapatnamensis]
MNGSSPLPRPARAARIDLAYVLIKRDILGRYRGSAMGLLWSFLVPLMMLGIYTFVFGEIFQARWSGRGAEDGATSTLDFALLLFIGLMNHSLLAESLTRSAGIILSHVNYVKRVVFPLDLLPVMIVMSALFHFVISLGVFITFYVVVKQTIHPTILWLPLILAPFTILTVGLSWFVAAAGVYYRDVIQIMNLGVTVLLFLSPVLYPASMLPENLRPLFTLNPLTFVIEESRAVIFHGLGPDWWGLLVYTGVALVVAVLGHRAFMAMRKGFADVL